MLDADHSLRQIRLDHLDALRQRGIEPYAAARAPSHSSAQARALLNAFSELHDPLEQRRRMERQLAERADARDALPEQLDEVFLGALELGMPPAVGLGLGIDRLAMWLLGEDNIRDVMLFPLLRSGSSASPGEDP